jgi:hypothetical protein
MVAKAKDTRPKTRQTDPLLKFPAEYGTTVSTEHQLRNFAVSR